MFKYPIINFRDIRKQVLLGCSVGFGFVFLNILNPSIAIGFPTLPFANNMEKYGVVSIIAPIFEEVAFRYVLLLIMIGLFAYLMFKIPAIVNSISAFSQATVFSLFHFVAYGASLSAMNASFIGAGLFGIMCAYLSIANNFSIIAPVLAHMIFNTFLVSKYVIAFAT